MIKINNITKKFKSRDSTVTAVNNVSFSINKGDFVSIIGKSGSGKTTLFALMGALEKPTEGSIIIDNEDITKMPESKLIKYRREKIGFVFQQYNLIPNLTALENVILPMEFAGVKTQDRIKRAKDLLNKVGIDSTKQKRKPSRLSGGEQQRISIARALGNKPSLILADEPTGNLDSTTGKSIITLLNKLSKSDNTTIIIVTHDLNMTKYTDITFKITNGKLSLENSKKNKSILP
jgi:putative ABC transport system ATP-binding protein